jgi:hypothetical protein
MKTKHIILAVFIFAAQMLLAQDTIFRTDRTKIYAKVLEIGQDEIRYKRASNPDGPLFVIDADDVWKITYANGETDEFNSPDRSMRSTGVHHPWMVGVNAVDMLFGVVTVAGEYDFGKYLSLRVPVSFGVNAAAKSTPSQYYPDHFYYNSDKIFSSGFKLLMYPAGRGRIANYYVGISGEIGSVRSRHYTDYPYSFPYPYPYPPRDFTIKTIVYGGTGITNGVQMQVSSRLSICLDATLGMVIAEALDTNPLVRVGVTMGYRFGGGKSGATNE